MGRMICGVKLLAVLKFRVEFPCFWELFPKAPFEWSRGSIAACCVLCVCCFCAAVVCEVTLPGFESCEKSS